MAFIPSAYAFDTTTIGQQPGPGGWWGGAGGGGRTASGIDYSATTPGASGEIGQISDLINEINRGAQTQANQARIPLAPQLETKSSQNIQSLLGGEIPADVQALLSQKAAESGVRSGSPGGPAAMSAYLRALGLTSLDLQQTGQQNLSAAYARNPGAPIYDPSRQLITPYEAAQLSLQAQGLAGRNAGAGAVPRGGGGYPAGGGDYYSPTTTTGTAPGSPLGPSIPFDWLSSIGYGSTPLATSGTGTTNIVPAGSELFPNEGIYLDPATMQAYDYTTGAPVDYLTPATGGTNLAETPVTPTDYSWDQVFAGLTGQ